MKNYAKLNDQATDIAIQFNGELFNLNLEDGDTGDYWNTICDKDGVYWDVNFYWDEADESPSVTVYPLKTTKKENGDIMSYVDTANGVSLPFVDADDVAKLREMRDRYFNL